MLKHFSHVNIKAGNESLPLFQTGINHTVMICFLVCRAAKINALPHIPCVWLQPVSALTYQNMNPELSRELLQTSVLGTNAKPREGKLQTNLIRCKYELEPHDRLPEWNRSGVECYFAPHQRRHINQICSKAMSCCALNCSNRWENLCSNFSMLLILMSQPACCFDIMMRVNEVTYEVIKTKWRQLILVSHDSKLRNCDGNAII